MSNTTLNPKTRSNWSCEFINSSGEKFDLEDVADVEQLSIFESIYTDCMFGTVQLRDRKGFAERQSIIGSGNEKIKVWLETPGGSETSNLEKTFSVNSYFGATYTSDGNGTINSSIGFTSPYLFVNNRTKIRRSFNAMTSSKIVDYITYDILKLGQSFDIDWDELVTNETTKNPKNMVVPGWTPFKTLNFLANHSMSEENGSSNYVFFENNTGFHFVSVDKLKSQRPSRNFIVGIDISKSLEYNNDSLTIRNNLIENFENVKRFDHSASMLNGMYGGKVFTHNILTKEYDNFSAEYDSDEMIMSDAGLNGAGEFPPTPDSNVGFMPSDYLYQIHDKKDKTHYAHRDMKMAELRTNIVKFDIAGDTNIWAGDVINITVPTSMIEHKGESDKFLSGKWLVTAIHHKINSMEYVQTLECMKDGFENIPDVVIPDKEEKL
jgi:hypothetical protein